MKEVARLAALVLAIGLVISRLGLVAHELVGHGLVANAFGGDVSAWSLHWFGGGWLGFTRARGDSAFALYAVEMGGIAVELVLAAGCAIVARVTRGTVRLGFGGAAWALLIHAGWYLAAGTYHGFGDGWVLHQRLGAARWWVVAPAALVIVAAAGLGGARIGAALRGFVPATTPTRQLAIVAVAMGLALGTHAALTLTEMSLRTDRPYQATMRTAGQRAVEHDLAARMARAEAAGQPLDSRAVVSARRELERQHRQTPVSAILIAAIGLAAAIGVTRSRAIGAPVPLPGRAVAIAGAIAIASIALVIVLDGVSP